MSIEGFYVSSHHTPFSVVWRGCEFAMVRATYGAKGLDRHAPEHMARAGAAGVSLLGSGHTLRADVSGAEQAEHFWRRTLELEDAFGRLALVVTAEDLPPPAVPWDRVAVAHVLVTFLARLRELAGRPCAVRGAAGYLASLTLPAVVGEGPLWLVETDLGGGGEEIPPPWSARMAWQPGLADGLEPARFTGDAEDWRRVFGLGAGLCVCPVPGAGAEG